MGEGGEEPLRRGGSQNGNRIKFERAFKYRLLPARAEGLVHPRRVVTRPRGRRPRPTLVGPPGSPARAGFHHPLPGPAVPALLRDP